MKIFALFLVAVLVLAAVVTVRAEANPEALADPDALADPEAYAYVEESYGYGRRLKSDRYRSRQYRRRVARY
ncbi:hypothetical protein Pmani_013921 [Petrolisthes manimaculis]|uniref:Uncharacterized protein n=1 Tax=Petrolisthes manimaculis TaxID=1843537 RepID=A0AAE1PWC6_9EUCA|nr:hypothetical protein Pmani_013921 [Petrolisthes manimaculis]